MAAKTEIREGEIVLDSQRVADMARQNRDFYGMLQQLRVLEEFSGEFSNVMHDLNRALEREPEFDAIPDYVQVDSSWADTLPACVACGKDVPWADALLMPCSTVSDGDVDSLGIVHRRGCPSKQKAA